MNIKFWEGKGSSYRVTQLSTVEIGRTPEPVIVTRLARARLVRSRPTVDTELTLHPSWD